MFVSRMSWSCFLLGFPDTISLLSPSSMVTPLASFSSFSSSLTSVLETLRPGVFSFFLEHLVHCHSFQHVDDFWIIITGPERLLS